MNRQIYNRSDLPATFVSLLSCLGRSNPWVRTRSNISILGVHLVVSRGLSRQGLLCFVVASDYFQYRYCSSCAHENAILLVDRMGLTSKCCHNVARKSAQECWWWECLSNKSSSTIINTSRVDSQLPLYCFLLLIPRVDCSRTASCASPTAPIAHVWRRSACSTASASHPALRQWRPTRRNFADFAAACRPWPQKFVGRSRYQERGFLFQQRTHLPCWLSQLDSQEPKLQVEGGEGP